MHSTDVTLILEQKLLLNSLEFQIPDHPKREGPTNYTMFENHQEMSQGKNYNLIFDEFWNFFFFDNVSFGIDVRISGNSLKLTNSTF